MLEVGMYFFNGLCPLYMCLCMHNNKSVCLYPCAQLHRSPYILINAVQVNFTDGGKRSLFNLVDLNNQKSGNAMLLNSVQTLIYIKAVLVPKPCPPFLKQEKL